MSESPKILELVKESNCSLHWAPLDALKAAVEEYESGKRSEPKMLILFLDDRGEYDASFRMAGMTDAQAITLLEIAKVWYAKELTNR